MTVVCQEELDFIAKAQKNLKIIKKKSRKGKLCDFLNINMYNLLSLR